jgi:hypothetical protein
VHNDPCSHTRSFLPSNQDDTLGHQPLLVFTRALLSPRCPVTILRAVILMLTCSCWPLVQRSSVMFTMRAGNCRTAGHRKSSTVIPRQPAQPELLEPRKKVLSEAVWSPVSLQRNWVYWMAGRAHTSWWLCPQEESIIFWAVLAVTFTHTAVGTLGCAFTSHV